MAVIDDREHEEQAHLEERRDKIVADVRSYVHVTFDTLGAASRQQTEELLEGLDHITLDESDIAGWEQFCTKNLAAMQAAAQTLYHEQFMDPLLGELGKTISKRVIEDLNRKFKDENVDYKEKERYVLRTLPERIKEWRRLKEQRDALLKQPHFALLTPALVPQLEAFRDEDTFIDLTYPERKGLTDHVEAAMHAMALRQQKLYGDIHAELTFYVQDEEIMHASKVGPWLRRIFDGKRTPAEIETCMEQVVRPYVRNWREAMFGSKDKKYKGFIDLEKAMATNGIPRGFRHLTKDAFLLMSYKQKTSYLSLAWARMEDPDASLEENSMLAALKLRIRHCLDTKDWEGAQLELNAAQRMAPDDAELRFMQQHLATQRREQAANNENEQNDPQRLLQEMRNIVIAIPSPLQSIYQQALCDGPAVFQRLTQLVYNRVWLHDVAGWNEQIEQDRIDYLRATRQQGKGILLDLQARNGDVIIEQIREHASDQAGKTPPRLSSDEYWGYWTSIIPQNVPIDRQREIVQNDNYPLKKALRTLQRMGYRYTVSGALTRQDGSQEIKP